MSYIAYINGNKLDLGDNKVIPYTKQANNLARLDDRQSNIMYKTTLPYSEVNKKAMEFVWFVGNRSNVPYQKNSFDLIDEDTGLHLIRNGWAIVEKSGTKGYEIYAYDGIIDLFKAIENKNFGDDVDLSELDHEKTIESVIASFTNDNYCYIINDYGGKTHLASGEINIDYLVPSVPVKYLWNKIFETFGFEYVGNIFDTFDFEELWLSFPKGIGQDTLLASVEYADFHGYNQTTNTYSTINITNGGQVNSNAYVVPETGSYKLILDVDGAVWGSYFIVVGDGDSIFIPFIIPSKFAIFKNNIIIGFIESDVAPQELQFNFNAGDVVYIRIIHEKIFYELPATATVSGFFVNKQIFRVNKFQTLISFTEELKQLNITDFFKEVLWFFALTIFNGKDGKYYFKTFDERLQSGVVDWSSKYVERTDETYIPKTYGQKNLFLHQYNDQNDNYNNGSFEINNQNLQSSSDMLKSKIFSAEEDIVEFKINDEHSENIYPTLLWNKEITENNGSKEVKYKELNNRFYFLRKEIINQEAVLKTGTFGFSETVTSLPIARFLNTSLKDFIPKYYENIDLLLNDFKAHKMQLKKISSSDFNNLDLDKIYYFDKENNYYLLNNLTYTKGKVSIADFYRVKYSEQPIESELEVGIILTNVARIVDNNFNLFFSASEEATAIYSQVSTNGTTWSTPFLLSGTTSPQSRIISLVNNFYVRLYYTDSSTVYSNIYYFSD